MLGTWIRASSLTLFVFVTCADACQLVRAQAVSMMLGNMEALERMFDLSAVPAEPTKGGR